MSALAGIQQGSKIACRAQYGSWEEIHSVVRLTKTTAVCDTGSSFRLVDGRLIGSGGPRFPPRYGHIATESQLRASRVRQANEAIKRLRVTDSNLEAVEALLTAVKEQA